MKIIVVTAGIIFCVGISAFTIFRQSGTSKSVAPTLSYFKKQAVLFAASTEVLLKEVTKVNGEDAVSIIKSKAALKNCRLQYKSIEFFLTYFLPSASWVYNLPNKVEVEEPFMEYHEPTGLQVIESLLFDKDVAANKKELVAQVELINSSAADINSLLYQINITDAQVLESVRMELIRMITLGITGFDSPELKTGITESGQVLRTIKIILSPFLLQKSGAVERVRNFLDAGIQLIEKNPDFNSFDRAKFLTDAILPLQYYLGLLINENGASLNTNTVLNYDARNLFSRDAIKMGIGRDVDPALASLGEKLFFEKGLSGNSTRSCGTCHQPEKYFTDGLPKSTTLNGLSTVSRNAPSLLYSDYQYSQFWDGRAKNLDEQINTVLVNAVEMGADHAIVVKRLRNANYYRELFKMAFPKQEDSAISIHNISLSITAFLETLSPFNSAFDRYMSGNKNALSRQQVKGFNLFMGKAQCGTCHYAPLFNGLIPPLYKRTELEVLGTTKTDDLANPVLDSDSGRFATYPIIFYMGAFKTPTLRNVAKTAPYMHNGAFPTLEKVLDFYNKGGGAGLGVKVPQQTLSPRPLQLTKPEIAAIIDFLDALTDTFHVEK